MGVKGNDKRGRSEIEAAWVRVLALHLPQQPAPQSKHRVAQQGKQLLLFFIKATHPHKTQEGKPLLFKLTWPEQTE